MWTHYPTDPYSAAYMDEYYQMDPNTGGSYGSASGTFVGGTVHYPLDPTRVRTNASGLKAPTREFVPGSGKPLGQFKPLGSSS